MIRLDDEKILEEIRQNYKGHLSDKNSIKNRGIALNNDKSAAIKQAIEDSDRNKTINVQKNIFTQRLHLQCEKLGIKNASDLFNKISNTENKLTATIDKFTNKKTNGLFFVSKRSVEYWFDYNGKLPDTYGLTALSVVLDVSIPYLLGLEDENGNSIIKKQDIDIFEKVVNYMLSTYRKESTMLEFVRGESGFSVSIQCNRIYPYICLYDSDEKAVVKTDYVFNGNIYLSNTPYNFDDFYVFGDISFYDYVNSIIEDCKKYLNNDIMNKHNSNDCVKVGEKFKCIKRLKSNYGKTRFFLGAIGILDARDFYNLNYVIAYCVKQLWK